MVEGKALILTMFLVSSLFSAPLSLSSKALISGGWNPIGDILNKIREAILSALQWIVD